MQTLPATEDIGFVTVMLQIESFLKFAHEFAPTDEQAEWCFRVLKEVQKWEKLYLKNKDHDLAAEEIARFRKERAEALEEHMPQTRPVRLVKKAMETTVQVGVKMTKQRRRANATQATYRGYQDLE